MWTFQEYCVPSNEPICRCGSLEFKFRDETLLEVLEQALKLSDHFSGRLHWNEDETAQYERHYVSIEESLGTVSGSLGSAQGKLSRSLWILLHYAKNRLSSDPRDKVFALYGALQPKIQELLPPPDYSKPVSRVFLETTTFLVNHEGVLPFDICELATAGSPSNNNEYPSWLLDFASSLSWPPRLHNRADTGAKAGSPLWPEVSADLTTLRISAKCLGPVHMVFPLEDTAFGVFQQLKTLLNSQAHNLRSRVPALNGQTMPGV
jgi:hypothetical protein